ncbi:MAG: hypothetical protein AABW48_01020 [Nanoarchaeota archaeon]
MAGWKIIKEMIKNKRFGEVKFNELKNYLEIEGFRLEEGGKHIKVLTQGGTYISGIPHQRTIRIDQLRYILRQVGRL